MASSVLCYAHVGVQQRAESLGFVQVTALWVTHRLEELEWADKVSYMDNGRIQFSGTPQEAASHLRKLGAHV